MATKITEKPMGDILGALGQIQELRLGYNYSKADKLRADLVNDGIRVRYGKHGEIYGEFYALKLLVNGIKSPEFQICRLDKDRSTHIFGN